MAFGRNGGGERAPQTQEDQRRRLTAICGALAGVTAVSLGLGAWQFAGAQRVRATYEDNVTQVVVAARDVPAGATLADSDLRVAEVPSAYVPRGAASDASELVGRSAIVDLSEGLAVPASAVQGASTSTLAQAVGDGMVAYSVAVSTDDGLAGLLRVGDRVNVLAGASGAEAAVVAEDVRVLALDASTTTPAQAGYATVTIEVTPDEATELFDLLDVAGGTCHLTMPPATEAAQGAM